MIYEAIDRVILAISPKVGEYRSLGNLILEDRARVISDLDVSLQARGYLQEKENDSAYVSYWNVNAQYSLIHVDVFGLNPRLPEAREAAAEIGFTFQWIKTADNLVDEHEGDKLEKLQSSYEILFGDGLINSPNEAFFYDGFQLLDPISQGAIKKVYFGLENQIKAETNKERMFHRIAYDSVIGALQFDLLAKYLDLPVHARKFFANIGVAAAAFDDVKDYQLDKDLGMGYEGEYRPQLMMAFAKHYLKALSSLSFREKRRHFSFLALGSLFEMRELFGLKDRT